MWKFSGLAMLTKVERGEAEYDLEEVAVYENQMGKFMQQLLTYISSYTKGSVLKKAGQFAPWLRPKP